MREKIKINSIFRLSAITAILLVAVSIFYYFIIFLPKQKSFISKTENKIDIVDRTSKCLDISEKKKDKYYDLIGSANIGRRDTIFNEKLNTCLILMQSSAEQRTNLMVVDTLKDKTLLFYSDEGKGLSANSERCELSSLFLMYLENGEKVVKEGCEKRELVGEMSEKINSFGFSFP